MFDRLKDLLAAASPGSARASEALFDEAVGLVEEGQFQQAIDRLDKLLQTYPNHRKALAQRLICCQQLSDSAGSAEAMYRMFELDHGHDAALGYQVMDAFEALENSDGLIEVCRRLIEHAPDQPELHFKLGKWLGQRGDRADAVLAFKRSAECFEKLAEWGDAAVVYRKLLDLQPDDAGWLADLGFVLSEDEQYEAALDVYGSLIEIDPDNVAFHYNIGRILTQQRRFEEAIPSLSRAIQIQDHHLDSLCYLGIAFQGMGDYDASVRQFKRAIEVRPDFQFGHFNLAITLIAQERLQEAHDCLKQCSRILHGEPFNDEIEERLENLTNLPSVVLPPFKVIHDREQFAYLAKHYELPIYQEIAAHWESLYQSLNLVSIADTDAAVSGTVTIDSNAPRLVRSTVNQRIRWCNAERVEHALNPELDYQSLENDFLDAPLQAMAIDQILTPEALSGLRVFCLGNTFWNNLHPGYQGAFSHDGFHSDLLLQIAVELRQRLPRVFKHHRWKNFWGFKHDCYHGGIRVHADAAAVNVNFWLTPDDANLDPEKGGLLIWDKRPPADWNFLKLNTDEEAIVDFLERNQAESVRLPYRENRAAIFSSDLFHRTDDIRFKPGFENRRLNVTMLYGDREEVNRWG